jgi:hypothetical protein
MTDLYVCPECRQLNAPDEVLVVVVAGENRWMCSCCAGVHQVIEYEPVDPTGFNQGFA